MKTSTLAIISAISLSGTAIAGEANSLSFGSEQCNIEFKNDVRIEPQRLQITNTNNQHLVYSSGLLEVDGQPVELNAEQQQALDDYTDKVRTYMPEVAQIALDGVKIAGVALEEVGAAFGISHNEALSDIVENIGINIEQTFYQDGAFVMGKQSFEQLGNDIESQFDEDFEQAVEQAMVQSIGSIFIALGSELLGSGGDMDEFEQRMERLGEQVEQRVELQASQIEQRADALCHSFSELAQQEAQLLSMIPELKEYQLLSN
ncbi:MULTISPECIES: YggN family protein [unclassified Pseudoalteromonas]|uniref:YggN family protein n=1 Tax=unclassified Pseudoalteromonas TaxID=194690 RepID=UPI000CF61534|nr:MULTISPECIES: YggN family protein [unclassified Pseudoalteromonas]